MVGPEKTTKKLAFETYQEFSLFLYEFFSKKSAITINQAELEQDLKDSLGYPGKEPAIILMGHYGNWEVALRQLLSHGYTVNTLSMKHSNSKVDTFFNKLRQHENLKCFDIQAGLRPLLKAVQNNEIIALACERDYLHSGIQLELFDHQFNFPTGPAMILKKMKLPAYTFYQERSHLLNFKSRLYPFNYDPQESIHNLSFNIAENLFRLIQKNPTQWLTFEPYFSRNTAS